MALWTIGILLVLGLAWFIGAVAVPFWQVRTALRRHQSSLREIEKEIGRLGGPEATARKISIFMHMPPWLVAQERMDALFLLYKCGKAGVSVLAAALDSPEAEIRDAAACYLGDLGSDAAPAVPALIRRLGDCAVGTTRTGMGYESFDFVDASRVRYTAAEALGNIGGSEAESALAGLLADPDPEMRACAAMALISLGAGSREAFLALLKAQHDPQVKVRVYATLALGFSHTGDGEIVAALVQALDDPDGKVRSAATRALYEMGTRAKGAERALEKVLVDGDEKVRRWASDTLKKIRGEEPPK
jgi:HEAT repeat protein